MGLKEAETGSERNLNVFSGDAFNRPEFTTHATLDARHTVGRNHLDGLVEVGRRCVVELSTVGDLILQRDELVLKVQEVGVRLEVGVLLGDHVDSGKHACEHALGGRHACDVAGGKSAGSGLASLCELVKNAGLMLGITLDDADHVGDHVVALIEQDIDVVPGVLGVFVEVDESIPGREEPNDENQDKDCRNGKDDDGGGFHESAIVKPLMKPSQLVSYPWGNIMNGHGHHATTSGAEERLDHA